MANLFSLFLDLNIEFYRNEEFNIKYNERWFSPIDRSLRRELKSSFKQGSFWFGFVKEVLTSPASTTDAKALVVSPKSVFGAGGFGSSAFKVGQIRKHAEFVKVWPDLTSDFPGIGIEICGYAIDKSKKNSTVFVEGFDSTIEIDGSVPTPFHVSPTATKVMKNCWSIQNLNFNV